MDKTVGILASDAGGANQILSYTLNNPADYRYCLEGQAIDIFSRSVEKLKILEIEELVESCSKLITGTGWKSNFEVEGIWLAKQRNIKVITYLDHWTNYKERFCFNKELVLPDEIWVSDRFAKEIAISQFPQVQVILKENFYISDIQSSYKLLKDLERQIDSKDSKKILFLSEPAQLYRNVTGKQIKLDEFAALKNLLNLVLGEVGTKIRLRIRLHPSETREKFDKFLVDDLIELSNNQKIENDFAWADFVVGLDTYAMYVAACLKIPTATIVSAKDYELTIPNQGITDLRTTLFRSFIREI